MNNVIEGNFGKQARLEKVSRSSLCQNGHHRWCVEKNTPFDVKSGKLVTTERCSKCGKIRVSNKGK